MFSSDICNVLFVLCDKYFKSYLPKKQKADFKILEFGTKYVGIFQKCHVRIRKKRNNNNNI